MIVHSKYDQLRNKLFSILSIMLLSVAALPMPSAQALQSPVSFTAVSLPTYQTSGISWSVAQANGLVFVGGTFTSIRPAGSASGSNLTTRNNLAVFNAATGSPTSCAPSVTLPSNPSQATVRTLNVSPDKKTLYVGGYFSQVNGQARNSLAAIDIASCSLIANFKPTSNATVRAIQSTASAVYFGGDVTTANGQARHYAAAVSAAGTASPGALQPWAPVLSKNLRALALKSDDSVIVAGGDFDTVNGADSHALAVLNTTSGAPVKTFPNHFVPVKSVVKDVAVDDTGFYTGNEGTGTGVFDGRIALNWSGYSQRWRDTCLGATQAVVVYKSVVYSGSHAHDCSSMGEYPDGARHHFLAESVNSPSLLAWFPQTNEGTGEGLGPRDMVVAPTSGGDYLWAVGEFTTVNGVAQQGMTRFGASPDATPSAPATTVSSPSAGKTTIGWTTSLDNDNISLTYNVYRDNSTTPIYTKAANSTFWSRPQLSYTDTVTAKSTHSYKVTVSDSVHTTTSVSRSITVK
ncbi:MAG: Laminin sub domain 2 [Candidatus Saccharibacteria bacterium]|nr:Laminin sub domain 2 [Candidatus Saccharibacteria bacterium]